MTTSTSTFGLTIGRAIGRSTATIAHGACVAASYTGQFGKDVASGTVTAHVEHSARFAAIRAGAVAQRPISVAIVPKRKATAKA